MEKERVTRSLLRDGSAITSLRVSRPLEDGY